MNSNHCRWLLGVFAASVVASVAAAARLTDDEIRTRNEKLVRAHTILLYIPEFAEGSFYHCMVDGYLQGLPMDRVAEMCATQLIEDEWKGFGEGPLVADIGKEDFFDPAKIQGACRTGDEKIGGQANSSGQGSVPGYGPYTWGGDPNTHRQLDKETSERLKQEAVEQHRQANEKFWQAEEEAEKAKKELDDAKKAGDQQQIDEAQKKYDEAKAKADEAAGKAIEKSKEAQADPNKKEQPKTQVAQESACQDALVAARELLRECHRTDWKDSRCQDLQDRMNYCPDRARIMVDPEHGHSCAIAADQKLLIEAWTAQCEERKQFGPDQNPCVPPKFDPNERIGKGLIGDICNDPYVYLNPESNDCRGTLVIQPFGEVNLQELAVWGMNKLGGPLVVLPPGDPEPPPIPGPGPTPGPKD